MIKLNFNASVIVRLRELWRAYYSGAGLDAPAWEVGEARKLQLWEIAHIFGPGMHIGMPIPLETEFEADATT